MPQCGPTAGYIPGGGELTAPDALAVWQALLAAAKRTGFQPLSGTLEQATVSNAQYFRCDGTTLGFNLVVDNAVPTGSDRRRPRLGGGVREAISWRGRALRSPR